MKKILKKNQVIIYIIALMLVTAGYLNYTTNTKNTDLETSMQMESNDDTQLADIGDAQLVSSNDVVSKEETNTISNSTNETALTENTQLNQNTINTDGNTNSTTNETTINTSTTQQNNNDNDYFVKSKLERDTMYSQMIETYENVLNSSNSLETQKQTAIQEITKINETKNSIMICENLITTKGFSNNIVFVNGDSISVIIEAEELKQEEVAQIQNIISREMKAAIENIHIATK